MKKKAYLSSEEVAALKCVVGKTGYALKIHNDGRVSLIKDGKEFFVSDSTAPETKP